MSNDPVQPSARERWEQRYATSRVREADFALGALSREQLMQVSEVLRPVREAAGDF